ncbi:MAG: hypothetical protein MUF72_13865 [Elainella sp. Prado103]|jgi:hypothetical protein|nr:hypothetical protein [Elainella sp. Prado103]
MTPAVSLTSAPDLNSEDYVLLGLATCFIKQEGEVFQIKVVEPIPSAALEALLKGIPTSYERVTATTVGAALADSLPADFPPDAQLGEDFAVRAIAAARTYKSRSEAQAHIPIGTTKMDFNYSLDRKRVLNSGRVVKAEDNVKQHAYTHQVL